MIGFLKGKIADTGENYILLDVNGVGFELIATSNAVYKYMTETGEVTIDTYMNVREDAITLFAFENKQEKQLFNLLITVSGVGPKMAISILSGTSCNDICFAIANNDTSMLSRIKGLGKKTAEKIILELKEKVGNLSDLTGKTSAISLSNQNNFTSPETEDAVQALMGLGYNRTDALKFVEKVAKPEMKAEEIIRLCLKEMAK